MTHAVVRGLVAALLLGLWGATAQAELGGKDYLPSAPGLDAAARARARAEIEAERRREAERTEQTARQRAAEQTRRQAAQATAAARQPEGERLIEAHCLHCHARAALAEARHTWLGWQFTVLRMRVLNGAQVPPSAAQRLVAHLSKTQAAGLGQAGLEYGLGVMAVALLLAALALALHRRHTRVRMDRGKGSPE